MRFFLLFLVVGIATLGCDKSQDKPMPGRPPDGKSAEANKALDRGLALRVKNDLDGAIAEYSEAIRLDPTIGIAFGGRAMAWAAKGEHQKAIVDFDEAIRLSPGVVNLYMNRGIAWQNKKELNKAFADFNKAIELAPENAICFVAARHRMVGERRLRERNCRFE